MSTRTQPKEPPQRWTAARKQAVARDLRKGRDTLASIARSQGVPVATLVAWEKQGQGRGESLLDRGVPPLQSRLAGLA